MSAAATTHHLATVKTARLHVLGALGPATREVWIAAHGYGQLAARFVRAFEPIVSEARAVVAPEALNRYYLDPADRPAAERRVGATWMTREDREAEIADIAAYLDRVLARVRIDSPDAGVTALGFSQGAAAVARWVTSGDARLAGVVLWGSGLPDDLDWARARTRFQEIPLSFVLGDRDEMASAERIAAHAAELDRLGVPYRVTRYPGGHAIDGPTLSRLVETPDPA